MAKASTDTEKEKDAPAATPPAPAAQPMTIVMPSAQHAAQALAQELAEMKAAGIKLDEVPPGGRFMGTDGRLHDAHGFIIDDKKKKGDVNALDFEEANAQLAEVEQQRAALQRRIEAARAEAMAASEAK